jgi:CMP-N-acetylneuraminic acid synthetase
MRVLGIVTARGGSKGVPGKNIRSLAGKPLIAWTAEAALGAKSLARVILTTDDERIADVGRRCGLEVPFMRPPELAADNTPTMPVLQHAITMLESAGDRYDAVCLLQPTHPLRPAGLIDGCIDLMTRSGADAVVTVLPVPHHFNPHWLYEQDSGGMLVLATGEANPIPRRQELPPAYRREGSVYLTRCNVLMAGSLYGARLKGYPVDESQDLDIDTLEDWERAEAVLGRSR